MISPMKTACFSVHFQNATSGVVWRLFGNDVFIGKTPVCGVCGVFFGDKGGPGAFCQRGRGMAGMTKGLPRSCRRFVAEMGAAVLPFFRRCRAFPPHKNFRAEISGPEATNNARRKPKQ
jgi:hypothetical protein